MDYARMTLDEFDEEICDFGDLKDWCYEHGCEYCDDICSEDDMHYQINECLVDWAREYTWEELYRILDNIPTGENWYRLCDDGDWTYAECYFDDYKEDVRQWGIRNGEFNEDSFDDDDEEEVDPYILEPTEKEDVALEDMFSNDEVPMVEVKEDEHEAEEEQEEFYDIFVPEDSEDLDWLV